MSTDPAVAAAQRAMNAQPGDPFPVGPVEAFALCAAREALAPIRARHYPVTIGGGIFPERTVCAHCCHPSSPWTPMRWPCADALDAYSPEELIT